MFLADFFFPRHVTTNIGVLMQYVAAQTPLLVDEVEILVIKEQLPELKPSDSSTTDPSNDRLQILEAQETLAGLKTMCNSNQGHLVNPLPSKVLT